MSKDAMRDLVSRAIDNPARIVLPEADDPSVLAAASLAAARGLAIPVLIGDVGDIERRAGELDIDLAGVSIEPLPTREVAAELAGAYAASGGVLSEKIVAKRMRLPLFYAAMLVRVGKADAMVAGISNSTADVIFASKAIIGMQPGIETPSSMFLMEIPGFQGPEDELIVFADAGVCIDPDPKALSDIAIVTADTVRRLLGWEAREALLSFSTKGSARHPKADATLEALALTKQRAPHLKIDGELQLDAAIIPEVASRKVDTPSEVAGRANTLIFPDLAAGNITYKAVQRFARANAYGPFLQGFAKTVSDLSRGSSVDDIIGVMAMVSVHAMG